MSRSKTNLPAVAWLSSGRLFVKQPSVELQEIESTFGRETIERRMRSEQLHGWKGRSGVWGSMGMAPPDMSQWEDGAPRRRIRITGITAGDDPSNCFYVLDLGEVGGLFQYHLDKGYESRLMHKEGFVTSDISRHPDSGAIAVSLRRSDGSVGLVIGENDGRFLKEVTLNDGLDEAPNWLRDGTRRLVFQSSAWFRDENGYAVTRSPYRIEMVDLDSEQVTTHLEEETHDLLQPQLLPDGTLYFIRRPYQAKPLRRPLIEDVKDIVLFPWRLLIAVFHFLNFFSVMFSGKPLTTAGGPEQKKNNQQHLMLWGHMIDAKRAMGRKNGDPGKLVPKDWRLVKRSADGTETILAENVLAFDVRSHDEVLYTDGSRVVLIRGDENSQAETVLATDHLIERVVVL
jgi:hypothetical protein